MPPRSRLLSPGIVTGKAPAPARTAGPNPPPAATGNRSRSQPRSRIPRTATPWPPLAPMHNDPAAVRPDDLRTPLPDIASR
ncbi:hypothetical protein Ga0100231_000600 [Opitutaceae bacterium TAV4]|nr:hypothetical protein Ga0100231_000600 [Opitutaceae bacterium TAV4]RRK01616.1 hypothetical protein Ga0100230_007175 [Opitutaceae bacterium TAV3]